MLKPFESYFKSYDHHRLYYQLWEPARPAKAVLIFVHGLNEHSGRYQNPVNYFLGKGYILYLFDQRGHGKSDGLRSFVDNFESYLKDLSAFTKYVTDEQKTGRIFMIGHSMGGQIVINYAGTRKTPLAGFVVSSANIEMAVKISWIKKTAAVRLSGIVPRLSLGNEIDPKWISRDRKVVLAYERDPLVGKTITLKLASEIMKNQENIVELAPRIHLPALVMHGGDDHICSKKASERFFERLGSKDKTLKIYEGFYHELFNEIGKEGVFDDMEEWLDDHL